MGKQHEIGEKRYYSGTYPVKVLSTESIKNTSNYPNAVIRGERTAAFGKSYYLYEALSDTKYWKKGVQLLLYSMLCYLKQRYKGDQK